MRKEEILEFVRKKGTLGALTLCLVGAVAFVSYQSSEQKQANRTEERTAEDSGTTEELEESSSQAAVSSADAAAGLTDKATAGDVADSLEGTGEDGAAGAEIVSDLNADASAVADASEGSDSQAASAQVSDADAETTAEETVSEEIAGKGTASAETAADETAADETAADETAANGEDAEEEDTAVWSSGVLQPTVSFGEASSLTWPAAGTVLMDYNMNGTVYFQTLNEYKYNPALIIASETGNPVVAAAKGIVESIEQDEETGTTLTLNIGDDYQLIYGQLTDLTVAEGDVAEQGQLLGYIAEPTKYYCEEGSNLYFAMKKDGQSVDPGLYLEG